jgi:hypothetical protein
MTVADTFRGRKALRPFLDAARYARALARHVGAPDGRTRAVASRAALLMRALPSRTTLSRRRTELRDVIAALPAPPPELRCVSIVTAPGSQIARVPRGVEVEIVQNPGEGSGPLLCFLAPSSEPLEDGWLARLAAAIGDEAVAATPLLVRAKAVLAQSTPNDLRVAAAGYEVVLTQDGSPSLRARLAGEPLGPPGEPQPVIAGSTACFLVDRRAFDAAGGLDDALELDAALVDLCLRLRADGGTIVVVPTTIVADHRPVQSIAELRDPFAKRRPAWSSVVARHGPTLVHSVRASSRPRLAITTAAPSSKMAPRWGDWHFGGDLARALRRSGYDVRLQTADQADSDAGRSCDVHLVLHGLAPVARTSGQRHVLWVISHPETLTTEAADEADLVFVASERFAAELRARTRTPVETLLQATAPERFRPRPSDPRHAHPVVVVAKTRTVARPIVADAIAAGLRPAIYGSGWDNLVDPALIVADYVRNDELPVVYSSAGVVLNDHWETMRALGFVSNRIFDVLACGTPVVSDHMEEIADLFGDAVPTFTNTDELRTLVEIILDDPEAARARARRGRDRVLAAHTFDHRAGALSDALHRHRLFTVP